MDQERGSGLLSHWSLCCQNFLPLGGALALGVTLPPSQPALTEAPGCLPSAGEGRAALSRPQLQVWEE